VAKKMVEVYAIKINTPIEDEMLSYLISHTSYEKQERLSKLYFEEDVKRTLYGDLLVRHLACEKLNILNDEVIFEYNEFSKPFLRNNPNFKFNISHSGDFVVCAIGKEDIGIDIEQIKPIDLNIAKQFFSENEYQDLISKPDELRLKYFYDLWTLKESFIKCIGKGMAIPLNSFYVSITKNQITIRSNSLYQVHFRQFFLDENYKLSICSKDNCFVDDVKIENITNIIDRLV